jgi:hypothetical protein
MSFQPVIPQTGLSGWRFLQRTMDAQTRVFQTRPDLSRDTAYFEAKIGSINTAEDLVADRRLLRVALGAFGLQEDINNRFFIRKVLEGGILREGALANRLSDDRYRDMSRTFGFGDLAVPSTRISDFGTRITERYRQQQFELAVGQQSESLRLALTATRDLPVLVSGPESDRTKWFKVMGRPPLRNLFETAFGLPKGFGSLDLEQQLGIFQNRANRQLGLTALSDLQDQAAMDRLVQRFLLRADSSQQIQTSSAAVALGLLMNNRR